MTIPSTPYGAEFYAAQADGSLESARVVAPLITSLIHPVSVVDVGCGVGTWLRVFADLGVEDFLGLDGDYVDRSNLKIPTGQFLAVELTTPPELGRKFDLALCLEVAEHLPHSVANRLISFLTTLAPVVLFSAAIPGQGGTNHVNEQWPHFWKQLFAAFGYSRLDPVRPRVWRNPRVEWWYQQNIYLYASAAAIAANPLLQQEFELANRFPFELIHDGILGPLARKTTVSGMATAFPGAVLSAVQRKVGLPGG